MAGRISTQIALLAFAVAIVAGLCAGNSPALVLQRALVAMFVGLLIGKFVGWSSKLVLRDHLQRKKLAVDQAHCAAAKSRHTEGIDNESQTVDTG